MELLLILEGREPGVEEESGESRTKVPSLFVLWVQSWSSKYDLKATNNASPRGERVTHLKVSTGMVWTCSLSLSM